MWKTIELNTAKYFNTSRRNRGNDFSQSDVEIKADIPQWLGDNKIRGTIIAECKYRSNELGIVKTYNDLRDSKKITLGVIEDEFIITTLESFKKVFILLVEREGIQLEDLRSFEVIKVKKHCPKYIHEFISQARDYVPEVAPDGTGAGPTLPILSCAKRGCKGIYAIFSITDVQSFIKTKDSYRVS